MVENNSSQFLDQLLLTRHKIWKKKRQVLTLSTSRFLETVGGAGIFTKMSLNRVNDYIAGLEAFEEETVGGEPLMTEAVVRASIKSAEEKGLFQPPQKHAAGHQRGRG